MENIIVKYLEFVLACYVVRFLATRFISEFQSVKKFYYRREILPGVRNWNNRIKMMYYFEFFSFLQSLLIALFFMIFFNFVPLKAHIKLFIGFLTYSSFIIADKVRFSILLTNYPYSLLMMDTGIFLFVSFLQFIVMAFMNATL
ncbi:hypothetical protein SZ47_06905 [Brachyspira hyodysenteriae]|uniref:Uncharacterized protein n=1 Tax=Brachyspira hyodysenteriae ATCC 27164 TaxID=1266923 RepID=A0A3B6VQY2_BRAHO|nr:hypothetical protein [Brachyspira hyodysenteriae]ANN63240.1 hypothetical protein BHYOB78_04995 [Brachyspira hyodysenteriae ATCC 27164]KLI24678.1 hypothetical protein SZ47_06905 [Brachyspira hyodysenteriae]MCZ9925674.1 hypothetical protein [Brachyspira hyodysenteriae]